MPLDIALFPALSDNFGYLVRDAASGRVAAIDAPEEGPILEELEKRDWRLTDILITHHHPDHTDAIAPLKEKFGAHVTGPKAEADKISGLDTLVSGGDTVMLGETRFDVIDTPGHTLGHIVYYSSLDKVLFSADALFSLGVGRMFEGEYEPMWEGLKRLRALDPQTLIYCGHEYSRANAKFALSVDPDNQALKDRADEIERQLERGEPTIPARLSDELAANPFLRADDNEMGKRLGLQSAAPWSVFGAIRKAKDDF